MTTQTTPPPPVPAPQPARSTPPVRIALSILHLAGLGIIGSIAFSVLSVMLGLGLGLVLVVGVGLLFLVAFVYALYATAWFEVGRASSLYRLDLPPLRWRGSTSSGFGGWLLSLWSTLR